MQAFGFYHVLGSRTITNGPSGQTTGSVLVGEIAPSGINVRRRFQIAFTQDSSGALILYKRAQTDTIGTWGDWSLLDTGGGALAEASLAALIQNASDNASIRGTENLPMAISNTEIEKLTTSDLRAYVQRGMILAGDTNLNLIATFGMYHVQGARTITNGPDGVTVGSLMVGEVAPSGTNTSRHYQIAFTQNSSGELILYKRAQTDY